MGNERFSMRGNSLVARLVGRLDAMNAEEVEQDVKSALASHNGSSIILDLEDLSYVSSAGLRVFLRLAKQTGKLSIENARSAVYEVLEMTGFSEMFEVRKAFRRVSIDGCDEIGRGAKAAVYRLDPETIVKVVFDTGEETVADIERERVLARTAFVAGIPTAISYDVVRVGDRFGAVYELLNANTLADLVASGTWTAERAGTAMADIMAQMHETHVNVDSMPSARDIQLNELSLLDGRIDDAPYRHMHALVADLADDDLLIHGDYHAGNIMVQDDEPLLIDMDTLAHGNPVLELGPVYNAYVGFGEIDHAISEKYLGFSYDTSLKLWETLAERYAEKRSLDLDDVLRKAEFMGRMRQIRRIVAHDEQDGNHGKLVMERCLGRLSALVEEIGTLSL
jgi:uncharacterized protein (TIGR02172 family)